MIVTVLTLQPDCTQESTQGDLGTQVQVETLDATDGMCLTVAQSSTKSLAVLFTKV